MGTTTMTELVDRAEVEATHRRLRSRLYRAGDEQRGIAYQLKAMQERFEVPTDEQLNEALEHAKDGDERVAVMVIHGVAEDVTAAREAEDAALMYAGGVAAQLKRPKPRAAAARRPNANQPEGRLHIVIDAVQSGGFVAQAEDIGWDDDLTIHAADGAGNTPRLALADALATLAEVRNEA